MRKTISIIFAATLVLCLSTLAYAFNPIWARTEVRFTYAAPAHPIYFVEVSVEKLNGSQNRLTITITEFYPDGTEKVITESYMIPNNAAGEYVVGNYIVYVDAKGNVQIRKCEVVGQTTPGTEAIGITSVATGNGQADINFAIVSVNGKGYTVYLSENGEVGSFKEYANVSYNATGAQIKKLTNGKTYWAYIEYNDGNGNMSRSTVVSFTPNK